MTVAGGFGDTPLFAALAAEYAAAAASPPGRHHWTDESRTEEVPVARHYDHDGDGVADQADPDWLPEPPEPVTPVGPSDPEDEVYSRCGDHEPPRWPEPSSSYLAELQAIAAEVDPTWLALAALPILEPERP